MNTTLYHTSNIKKIYTNSFNIYNSNSLLQKKVKTNVLSNFGTFKSEKNLKLIKLYNLIFYITGQRPSLKKIKFNYIKKKILKRFFLISSISNKNFSNSIFYLTFYLHFFHLYYQNKLKYNYSESSFLFYIDNIQFFFKNYNKQNHKTQLKFEFFSSGDLKKFLLFFLSNFYLIKLKK
jgi:hypothetical protein